MGLLSVEPLAPFSKPVRPINPTTAPDQIRGNDNQLAKALNAHITDPGLHTVTTSTSVASGAGAIAIADAVTGLAVGWISGDNGAGKTFVDNVVWNGATNVKTVISSTTVDGAPDARTYTVAGGVLKLQMAGGTYTIALIPLAF